MGTWQESLGALFVSEDWKVRVFWSSSPVDRTSDHLYIHMYYSSVWVHGNTLPLHTLLFSGMNVLPQENLRFSCLPWRIIPLRQTLPGTTMAMKCFRRLICLGYHPYQKNILQELGGLELRVTFNIGQQVALYTTTAKHGPKILLKFTRWILLVRLAKINYRRPSELNIFSEKLHCG